MRVRVIHLDVDGSITMSYTENQCQLKCNMRVKMEIQALPKLSIEVTCLRHPERGYTTLFNGRAVPTS